jgi:hypothetical protein
MDVEIKSRIVLVACYESASSCCSFAENAGLRVIYRRLGQLVTYGKVRTKRCIESTVQLDLHVLLPQCPTGGDYSRDALVTFVCTWLQSFNCQKQVLLLTLELHQNTAVRTTHASYLLGVRSGHEDDEDLGQREG